MYRYLKLPLSVAMLALAVPLAGCVSDDMFADDAPKPYGGSKLHPITVENGRATVENCGQWPTNLGDTSTNELNANHGCAVQANIAAMAAYPDDLVGKKRRLPKPLGDVQYSAIKKITSSASAGGGTTGGQSTGTPTPAPTP